MIGTGIALLASGIASAVGGVSAAKMASKAAKNAGDISSRATEEALKFEREKEAERLKEYMDERARAWKLDDVDRQRAEEDRQFKLREYGLREGRLQPYRDFGGEGLGSMASLLRPNAAAPSLHVRPRPGAVVPVASATPTQSGSMADLAAVPSVLPQGMPPPSGMTMADLARLAEAGG